MKPGTKASFLLVVVVCAILGVVYAITQLVVLRSFIDLEERYVQRNTLRAVSALEENAATLGNDAADWAIWDDSYAFVQDRNQQYIDSNLPNSTFNNLHINLVVFIDTAGHVIYSKFIGTGKAAEAPLPTGIADYLAGHNMLWRNPAAKASHQGIVMLPSGPMLLGAHAIVTSSGAGPARGTLIMARLLDAAQIDRLASIAHLSFVVRALNGALPDDFARVQHTLSTPDKVAVVPQDKQSIHGYAMLRDIERNPALMLRMDQPRDIYQSGLDTVKYFLISLSVIAVVAALMMRLLIGKLLASTQKHREVEQRYRAVVQQSGEGIILVESLDGRLVDANSAFCRLLGYGEDEIGRLMLKDLQDGSAEAARQYLANILSGARQISSETQYRRKDGGWIDVEIGAYGVSHGGKQVVCIMVRDITERKIAQERIQYLANYDGLTNLPNRTLLLDRLRQDLAHAERNHWLVAVVVLNLDRFKVINDSLGHHTGDLLLQAVGQRLEAAVRHGDTVSRQGGDEFVIVLSQVKCLEDVSALSEKILRMVAQPYEIRGQEISITTGIGICLYPQDGMDADSLLKNAEMAMYRAKALGGNDYQIFNIGMETGARERLRMEVSLHHAVERDELYLVYQPQVNLATGRVFGMEALVRWRHPELGEIMPVKFIPLAEESGLILPIGEWVLRTACEQMRQWQNQGYLNLVISVNLSARQLRQKGLVSRVAAALDAAGLPAASLDLELTESMLMNNINGNISILNMLKEMGIALSIDDFGTGYSSLAYLHSLPIETLKIDRAFVRDIVSRDGEAPIAKAVIVLAHSLGYKVIAEGVETDEQLGFLRAQGCDAIQGYYFSRPLPTDDFTALLRSGLCMPVPESKTRQVARH